MTLDLRVLEEKRKKIVKKIVLFFVIYSICGAALVAGIFMAIEDPFYIIIVLIILGVIGVKVYKAITKSYVGEFKTDVIYRIVHFIDKNLSYSKDGYISEHPFTESKVFQKSPDRYKGDDYVSGKVGKIRMEFSELHAEYKTVSTDSKRNTRTQWHTIFKGLFFVGDFNKNFNGETLVLPDTAEKLFGKVLGSLFQSWNFTQGQLIKLEDPEFEKLFVVYGSDQIEARYILSTSLMKRIVDFKKKS